MAPPGLVDSYATDSTYGDINIKDVPLYIAVEKLASLFKRQIVLSGRVLVLRDQTRIIKDRINRAEFPWTVGPQESRSNTPDPTRGARRTWR